MFANDDEDDEWNNNQNDDNDQIQGYQALLDQDDEEISTVEEEDEEEEQEEQEQEEEEENSIDDGQIKPFSCHLCSISFSKFETYCEHFVSVEHRYKRRDEKRRLGEGCVIETPPVETFVNLLLYNKISLESVQIVIEPIDFSFSGRLEYNNNKYEHQHASTINDLYQSLTTKFNQDFNKYQLKMPPQSFFVARDICRKEVDHIWSVPRYSDDTGKSVEQIVKEVLDFCVYKNVETERERLIGQSIQTWRMFHRQETKAGFWCDICKQCFRKRKPIICHFETSEKHENNLKRLPPYRRAVQHSLFTGRSLNEFIPMDKLNYFRTRINTYRIPPSNKNMKNAFYCTFCKKSFESAYSLEKHLGWKGHREILRKRRQHELDNLPRLVTYLNFNQLNHEQRNGGIQQMAKTPEEYRLKYNLQPFTIENIQDDIRNFDAQLAQQIMQNNNNNYVHNNNRGRGRGRGNQTFRSRANFHQQNQPRFNSGQFHQPRSFRPQNPNYFNGNNKRQYPQNNNYYNQRQPWSNKKPRFDRPPSSNRVDYRYVANQNTYQQFN